MWVALAALLLAGGAPWTAFASHLAGNPDRGEPFGAKQTSEASERNEATDAEDAPGGAAGIWAPARPLAFAPQTDDPRPTFVAAAAVTRWIGPRLPRPPPGP